MNIDEFKIKNRRNKKKNKNYNGEKNHKQKKI